MKKTVMIVARAGCPNPENTILGGAIPDMPRKSRPVIAIMSILNRPEAMAARTVISTAQEKICSTPMPHLT